MSIDSFAENKTMKAETRTTHIVYNNMLAYCGKSKAELTADGHAAVQPNDVAGLDAAREWICEPCREGARRQHWYVPDAFEAPAFADLGLERAAREAEQAALAILRDAPVRAPRHTVESLAARLAKEEGFTSELSACMEGLDDKLDAFSERLGLKSDDYFKARFDAMDARIKALEESNRK